MLKQNSLKRKQCTYFNNNNNNNNNNKATPVHGYYRLIGFQKVEAPGFLDNRHRKVVRLSALRTGRLYHPRNIPGTHFRQGLIRLQGHVVAERITLMKNSNDTIGNRTHDLPVAIAVPQQTAPPRAPIIIIIIIIAVTTPNTQHQTPNTQHPYGSLQTAQERQKKHTNNKQK